MAHPLEGLIARQYQPSRRPLVGDEEELGQFLPEGEIMGAQQAIAESGRGADRPYFIPSREELQTQGFQQLRKMLGLQAIEQAAKERAIRIPQEYGLERERVKGQASILSARERAEAARQTAEGRLSGIEMQQRGAV